MDTKKALKNALDLSKQGKFKECLSTLQNIDGEVNNKWVMAVIIGCCNSVVKSCPEDISASDLFSLLEHIVLKIKDINEADLLNYVQSLFHIVKLFTKKKCYDLITKMNCILIPLFLPPSLARKESDTYLSTAGLLHNLIVNANCEEFEALTAIRILLCKMYAKVSNMSALLSTSSNCAIHLININCPLKLLEAYFLESSKLIKLNNMKIDTDEEFKHFLSHFFLIYYNSFKRYNFEEAANFYKSVFETNVEIFSNDDYTNVLRIIKFPLLLSPKSEGNLEDLMKCKKSLNKLDRSALKRLLLNKLQSLIYTVVSYYKSVSGTEWNNFSEVCRMELLQFIREIGKLELLLKFSCPCKCLVDKNIYQAFCYSQYISTLLEISVRQRDTTSEFNNDGVNLLIQFCEHIETLIEYNCEKWQAAWNMLGMAIYNLGVHLYQNSDRGCLHYFYCLIKYFVKFEYRKGQNILKFSMLGSAFTVISNYNSENYKKCMALTALGIQLCPNQRDSLIMNWIRAKVSQRDAKNDVQKITLVSVFEVYKKEIEFLIGGVDLLTQTDKMELLVFEIEQYKKKWKSKVPMMSVLKEICAITDLNKTVEVIINIFGDCELTVHEEVPEIIQKTLKRFEEHVNSSPQATISLAVLYYMRYKYCVKDTVTKNADDMERTMSVTQKSDEPPDAIPKDPSDECDIVSFYDSLNLTRYFSVMKYLNKSLELFASILKDSISFTMLSIYDLLVKISMEYRLHRYGVKSLQALQLALKVAQFENNACNIVWAIAFIVENSDVTRNYVKYLLLIADKQLENIELTSISNLKVILTYYICKAKSLLYNDYKEAYRIFQIANKLYEIQEDKSELKIIKSQLYVLEYKFVMMPCNFGIVDHRESTLLTIHRANSAIYDVYHNSIVDGSYEMSVLLDINEELVKLHHYWRSPREVRSYCKETIILAQRLVLPIRCAYYLVYLAHSDLRSSRYNDCQVKIEGLGDILCLKKYNTQVNEENKVPTRDAEIDKDITVLTNDMREMVLDLPVPAIYRKQFSPSSPTLVIQPFHLPAFTSHEEYCNCFCCTSLEYQSLVLEKTRLDALFNVKQKNFTISTDFFRGALNYFELCSKRYESTVETIGKCISYDLIPEFGEEMLEAHGFTLLDYSYHLMRSKNSVEALKVTDNLIDLVSPRKIELIFLYNEALFQKLGYLTEIPSVTPSVDTVLEMESLCPEPVIVSTTPMSKQSKVTFSVDYSPNFSPPKRRVKKCLPFNLSPNHDSVENNKASPSSKRPKTPAPKFKILSGNSSKKTKNPSAIHVNGDSKRSTKKVVFDDDCSGTSTVTPGPSLSIHSEAGLKSRTKILTERLRRSAKKPEVAAACLSGDGNDVPGEKNKPSFKKNLFEQVKVEKEPSASHGGAVKRSTRRRKV